MDEILHTIKAYLYDNSLTDDPNDFSARVNSERSLSIKDVCKSAVNRGGADISAASMEHGVNLFLKEMAYNLCDGFSINTGYFMASPTIKGVFTSPKETFNPEKHSIQFLFNQGEILRKELSSVTVEILGVAESGTYIAQVVDVKTGSVNEVVTMGYVLKITGQKIKIAGDNPDVGIFFVNEDGTETSKVNPTDIITNNPSELMIMVPKLSQGMYKLQIVTQFTGNSLLKEPRTVIFDKVLKLQFDAQ